jgi:hypothetical protein
MFVYCPSPANIPTLPMQDTLQCQCGLRRTRRNAAAAILRGSDMRMVNESAMRDGRLDGRCVKSDGGGWRWYESS